MTHLPPPLLDFLLRRALTEMQPEFVRTDAEGLIVSWSSGFEGMGFGAIEAGQPIGEVLYALEGMYPFEDSEPFELPDLASDNGRFVDVHVLPDEVGTYVLLVDVSEAVKQRQMLQQRGNELSLLAHKLDRTNRFVRRTFGTYLSDEIVEEILEGDAGVAVGGELRTVSILMNDLRGFTSMCDRLPPDQVVKLLNYFLGVMTEVILEHRGTIDEFLGDAILVLFGAPVQREDDALRAVACAVDMQRAMARVNEWTAKNGLPHLGMGIAVNTGTVIVGSIGSSRRLKYGVVGSPVNLTARIESYTVGGQILAPSWTLDAAGPSVQSRGSMMVSPKGFERTIELREVVGVGAPYNTAVPRRDDELIELTRPLTVKFAVIEDKQIKGEEREAQCVRLSRNGGVLHSEEPLPPLTNLRIRISDERLGTLPGDLYAKVSSARAPEPDGGDFQVHFTMIPPVLDDYLQWRLAPVHSNDGEQR